MNEDYNYCYSFSSNYCYGFSLVLPSLLRTFRDVPGYPQCFYPTITVHLPNRKKIIMDKKCLTLLNKNNEDSEGNLKITIKFDYPYPARECVVNNLTIEIDSYISERNDIIKHKLMRNIFPLDVANSILKFIEHKKKLVWKVIPITSCVNNPGYNINNVIISHTMHKYDDTKNTNIKFFETNLNIIKIYFAFLKDDILQKDGSKETAKSYGSYLCCNKKYINDDDDVDNMDYMDYDNGIYVATYCVRYINSIYSLTPKNICIPRKKGCITYMLVQYVSGSYVPNFGVRALTHEEDEYCSFNENELLMGETNNEENFQVEHLDDDHPIDNDGDLFYDGLHQ